MRELYIDEPNKKNEVNEISENIVIIMSGGLSVIEEHDNNKWEEMVQFVSKCAGMKSKDHPSLGSKTIFKYMDLEEEC